MQLESSDESLACLVGLQSTPSSGIRAMADGREILSAANGSTAVEHKGDMGVITTCGMSAGGFCDGPAFRLAHGDGRFQRRGHRLSLSDCAGGAAPNRSLVHRGFGHRALRVERLASKPPSRVPQVMRHRRGTTGGVHPGWPLWRPSAADDGRGCRLGRPFGAHR